MASVQKIKLSPSRDIPFNKLVLSQSNVRRVKAGVSIEQLAESIAQRTLLQSPSVRAVVDADGQETGMFEVPAGGRRYRALELLVQQKRMAKTQPVPCVISRTVWYGDVTLGKLLLDREPAIQMFRLSFHLPGHIYRPIGNDFITQLLVKDLKTFCFFRRIIEIIGALMLNFLFNRAKGNYGLTKRPRHGRCGRQSRGAGLRRSRPPRAGPPNLLPRRRTHRGRGRV
jgi:ParB-like nuclease domain